MVIDVERRRCVEPSQCVREPPTIISRTSENGQCDQQFTCPFNTPQNDYYAICQYILSLKYLKEIIKYVGISVVVFTISCLNLCFTGWPNYY